jgi:hypothetical protein
MAHALYVLDTYGYRYTYSSCVTLIAFTLQQWLHEHVSMLRYTYIVSLTFVNPCIMVQFIKKNPTRCNSIWNFIIPYWYEAQYVSGDILPIIRSLKLHWQPLVFHMWKVVGCVFGGRFQAQCAWQRPSTTRPTTFHVWKTRGCQCSFRLLMMGSVSSETYWASYQYGIIKFDTLLHLVGFFFMNFTLPVLF